MALCLPQAGLKAFATAVPRAEGTFSAAYAANTLWGFAVFGHHPGAYLLSAYARPQCHPDGPSTVTACARKQRTTAAYGTHGVHVALFCLQAHGLWCALLCSAISHCQCSDQRPDICFR